MTRQTHRPRLEVQESFETTRLSSKCLIAAYTRVVPVQRRIIRTAERGSAAPRAARPQLRGGEHV